EKFLLKPQNCHPEHRVIFRRRKIARSRGTCFHPAVTMLSVLIPDGFLNDGDKPTTPRSLRPFAAMTRKRPTRSSARMQNWLNNCQPKMCDSNPASCSKMRTQLSAETSRAPELFASGGW